MIDHITIIITIEMDNLHHYHKSIRDLMIHLADQMVIRDFVEMGIKDFNNLIRDTIIIIIMGDQSMRVDQCWIII